MPICNAYRVLDLPPAEILTELVEALVADWHDATHSVSLPADYDPPAACLILVKRYEDSWQGFSLGDSCILSRSRSRKEGIRLVTTPNSFDQWLALEARERRDRGILDVKALLSEFRAQLKESRNRRNKTDGYSILEASRSALVMPKFLDLGDPETILLCTDGFFRAVDHYGLYSELSLIDACTEVGGVSDVMEKIRAIEASDPHCQRYLRFKPADDATAVVLRSQ